MTTDGVKMQPMNCFHAAEKPPERRSAQRQVAVILVAKLSIGSNNSVCRIKNISTSGALLETNTSLFQGQSVTIELRSDLRAFGRVMWSNNGHAGIKFDAQIEVARYLLRSESKLNRIKARAPRYQCQAIATLVVDGSRITCTMDDIGLSGARLGNLPKLLMLRPGFQVQLLVEGISSRHATVAWNASGKAGIRFRQPVRYTELQKLLELNRPVGLEGQLKNQLTA
jgi:phage gp46-like protein